MNKDGQDNQDGQATEVNYCYLAYPVHSVEELLGIVFVTCAVGAKRPGRAYAIRPYDYRPGFFAPTPNRDAE
jgi:hypothetical protein